jgi:nucleotide-binding universal stress UspA family protein
MSLSESTGATIRLLSSVKNETQAMQDAYDETYKERETYLRGEVNKLRAKGFEADYVVRPGFVADATDAEIKDSGIDLVVTTTRGKSGVQHWLSGGVSRKLVATISTPILLIQSSEGGDDLSEGAIQRIVVALDGSIVSEGTLPYARLFAKTFGAEVILTAVPTVPDMSKYRAPDEYVEKIATRARVNMTNFLNAVASSLEEEGIRTRVIVTGSLPARTILSVAEQEDADMIMLTSRGRGRLEVLVGTVAGRVVESTTMPIFLMPVPEVQTAVAAAAD